MTRFPDSSAPILSLSASKARSFGISENVVGQNESSEFFTVWQMLCSRLDAHKDNWQVSFSSPVAVSDYITMRCLLTVGGITREATGSDKGCLIQVGETAIGVHAPERAMLNAFCNAALHFGIVLPFKHLRAKKPPDDNHDLEAVVNILRKMQRKQKMKRGFTALANLAGLMGRHAT
ncbi:hypothetical protein [Pseudanabaena sp. 'Roaring Creek']|uniref:hypothetical protein n=1 Tax=Pseudanabaena sp. 'Roaring Creek' TaxID=1681830 RepID=UPI000B10B4EF|nr:hypothetical protein [Pseudanabaena sp. 'Roaring Creek']